MSREPREEHIIASTELGKWRSRGWQFICNTRSTSILICGWTGTWNSLTPYGAGWNGGGAGGYSLIMEEEVVVSDIRVGGSNLGNRVIVAAGGGGASGYPSYNNSNGGIGGDRTGGYGLYYGFYYSSYCGQGGTQKMRVGQESEVEEAVVL